MSNPESSSYTGRTRRKQTTWRVRAADVIAQWSITVGGIGTIVAVSTVFLFLLSVVLPLFRSAEVGPPTVHAARDPAGKRLALGIDEFRTTAWWVDAQGQLELRRLDSGESLQARPLIPDGSPTSVTTGIGTPDAIVGTRDGHILTGTIGFTTSFPDLAALPEPIRNQLERVDIVSWDQGVLVRTPQGQLRQQVLETKWSSPVKVADGPIVDVDLHTTGGGEGIGAQESVAVVLTEAGDAKLIQLVAEQNAFSGESTISATPYDLPARSIAGAKPFRVLISGRGDNVYLVWKNGTLQRFDVRDPSQIALLEERQLLDNKQATVTTCGFVIGRETLICGDSAGGLRAWFRIRDEDSESADGMRLALTHELSHGPAAITTFQPSERSRMIVVGDVEGHLQVHHVTTERKVLDLPIGNGKPLDEVVLTPKEDGLVALSRDQLWAADFDPRHPDATFTSLFRPVWYEGYPDAEHIWQSSYATSAPEPKLGLLPLIHGTIKATFYAMLFATPLALLAALYASEFLQPNLRSVLKPSIEMMASLPSVVLGFLAALVFAEVVERYVTQIVCAILCVPPAFMIASFAWQALPPAWTLRLQAWRVLFLPIPLVAGVYGGFLLGPWVERHLLAGDVMRWLDRQVGTGTAAWLFLLIPICAVLVTVFTQGVVNPWLRRRADHYRRNQFVALNFTKFVLSCAAVLLLAYLVSALLNGMGWDPRGTYVSTYVQRNAFVVGIVMGFAVIPIIFTIADDALTSVPQHLRSASLGCGATQWQTAIRVVVPTAVSGLFSAVMIGLGRAVGETMIVLMAGGNTPVMEWNLFEGFRTLSANIAVEMPEAVRDSTHYRTLFLAALTLFVLTFILNTIAEMVRIRFRRRAVQL